MLPGSALALWLTLLTLFPQFADAPTLHPSDVPAALPASALICVSTADRATFDDLRRGHCPHMTTRAPADAWFALQLPANAVESVLYTSEVYALKHGQLEVSIDGREPLRVYAFDPIATRPYYDARLAVPLRPAADRSTSLLLRMRIRDQRQLRHPEQQVMIVSRVGAQQDQISRWFWQGAFTGVMLIMALYHAFLWRAERLAAAAWYSFPLSASPSRSVRWPASCPRAALPLPPASWASPFRSLRWGWHCQIAFAACASIAIRRKPSCG